MEETRRESSTAAEQPRREGNQLVGCCGAAADGQQHQRLGTNGVEPLQGGELGTRSRVTIGLTK